MATGTVAVRDAGTGAVQRETEMMAGTGDSAGEEEFAQVGRKRKRKLKSVEMDVGEEATVSTAAKRPNFPPVDASTTLVRCEMKV